MKTFRACTGMLSSENDDFNFFKTAKNIKRPQIQSVVEQKHERKVAIELYYIYSKISKFRYW